MGWLKDIWRGYTDADRICLEAKLQSPLPPGSVVNLTPREYQCFRSGDYQRDAELVWERQTDQR